MKKEEDEREEDDEDEDKKFQGELEPDFEERSSKKKVVKLSNNTINDYIIH